jgi:hypothetical protein
MEITTHASKTASLKIVPPTDREVLVEEYPSMSCLLALLGLTLSVPLEKSIA